MMNNGVFSSGLGMAVMAAAVGMVLLPAGRVLGAEPGTLTVEVDKPGAKISPILYGLMTEEINHAYDGGLYGELIQNRTFQDVMPAPRGRGGAAASAPASAPGAASNMLTNGALSVPRKPLHWSVMTAGGAGGVGTLRADVENPVNKTGLPVSLRLDITDAGNGARVGAANDGFWGIPVKANTTYKASFYARSGNGFAGPVTVDIESNDGKTVYATGTVADVGEAWKKYEVVLKTGDTPSSADTRFVISGGSKGSLWLSLVSLFPPTYKDRPNGDRVDISKLLSDMGPGFLRFPGGNYLEGDTIATRFDWKKTIGPLEDRPGHMGTWQYRSSDGFGLQEFLGWCDDIGMEPVLAVYAGYSLGGEKVTGEQLKPFIQDALDEIEYVTGDVSTKWGAERAKNGHPAPYKLTYVEVGNEDQFDGRRGGGSTYDSRFTDFYDAIKAKYPNLQIIATTPVKTRKPDVVDDHYYKKPGEMYALAHRYDKQDRNGPKVFVGEWATRDGANRIATPQLEYAVADAAFLTGLERNSDVVMMSCYAPLLVNVNPAANGVPAGMEWYTDLIGYDALTAFGSPSYYVQKMFIHNKGDVVLPVTVDVPGSDAGVIGLSGTTAQSGVFATASREDATGDVIVKVVNAQEGPQTLKITLNGVKNVDKEGLIETITGDPKGVNTVGEPEKFVPKKEGLPVSGPTFSHEFPGYSVSVVRVKTKDGK